MDLLCFDYNNKWNFFILLSTLSFIFLINILTIPNISNLIITFPQIAVVIYCILKNRFENAVLLHFVFFMSSLSVQGTLGMIEGQDFLVYNYGSMKLFGPVRVSYVFNILFVILCIIKKLRPKKNILFYRLFKTFCWIGGLGLLIGIIGLVIHPYYVLEGFKTPAVYMFVVLSSCYILLCLAEKKIIKSCYYLAIATTMAGIISSFLGYFVFGIKSSYSVYDIVYCADIVTFAPILIAGFFAIKEKLFLSVSLLMFFAISTVVVGGKEVFNIAFVLVCLTYFVFFDNDVKRGNYLLVLIMKPIMIISILLIIIGLTVISDSMVSYKVQSALSMFSDDMSEISRSPFIRIASLLNILYEGIANPFTLIFGNGYGGYFEDKLGLLDGMNLTNGAWSEDVVAVGRFPSGHDTFVSIPLFNGLFGLGLIIRISYMYIKRIPYNYMNSMAFSWILLVFYFNTIFAVIGCFFMLGAEYDIKHSKRSKYISLIILHIYRNKKTVFVHVPRAINYLKSIIR